jgi:hypothetical protein
VHVLHAREPTLEDVFVGLIGPGNGEGA